MYYFLTVSEDELFPRKQESHFLPYAHKAIQDAENGKQIIRDLKGIEAGSLHIGVTYSMSPLLIAALNQFTKIYPKIKVEIRFATSEELLKRLEENDLDFVLLSNRTITLHCLKPCRYFHQGFALSCISHTPWLTYRQLP